MGGGGDAGRTATCPAEGDGSCLTWPWPTVSTCSVGGLGGAPGFTSTPHAQSECVGRALESALSLQGEKRDFGTHGVESWL